MLIRLDSDAAGAVRATVCSGGHPLPLVRRVDGSVETVGGAGDFLGVHQAVGIDDPAVVMRPGDVLVAFTDGITERHRRVRQFGEEGVVTVPQARADADTIAARVEEAARAFAEGDAEDDMAVVVVRVPLPGEHAG